MREREHMAWSVVAVSDRLRWRRFVSPTRLCRPLHATSPASAEHDCVQHALIVSGEQRTKDSREPAPVHASPTKSWLTLKSRLQ